MHTQRRQCLRAAGVAAFAATLFGLCTASAWANTWPSKPVRLVIPSAAGSAPDIMGRLLAAELEKRLGQPVVAENKPGAGGSLGSDQVAKSAPDGHTLVMGNIGSHAMNVGVYPQLPYHPLKSFEPVAMVALTPSLMSVSADLPVKSVQEFLTYAKQEGERVTFSSGGNGSSSHLAGEYLNLIAGLKMRHVPYKSVPQALGDVAAQRVTVMVSNLPPAMPLVQAGKLRPLAVTTPERSASLPDVPSLKESGLNFEQTVWFALFAPAGTPQPVVQRLNQEANAVLQTPAFQEKLATTGARTSVMTPQALREFVAGEIDKWTQVARDSGARAD